MFRKPIPAVAAAALLCGIGLADAQAAPSPVPTSSFSAAGLNPSDYTYLGSSTADFSGSGSGTLTLRSSSYADSFGVTTAPGVYPAQSVTIFSSTAGMGTSVTVAPTFNPFAFFFASSGSGGGFGSDSPATLYSDGVGNSTDGGQANLAIFLDSATTTYAFFFDDGGPSGTSGFPFYTPLDDNDYNDLVVTYRPASTSVPEPASLALIGTGLIGLGVAARRRKAA